MDEWATTLLSVAAGGLLVLLGQWLSSYFQSRQAREQRVLDLYSEFVGITATDLDRAKSVKSALLFKPNANDDQFSAWMAGFSDLEKRRHVNRGDLARLSFQIRILESDQNLRTMLEELCKAQPVYYNLGGLEGKAFEQQFKQHESQIATFSDRFESLCCEVFKKRRP